jgi:hypothetical protein
MHIDIDKLYFNQLISTTHIDQLSLHTKVYMDMSLTLCYPYMLVLGLVEEDDCETFFLLEKYGSK